MLWSLSSHAGIAAELPLRADVGAGAQDDVEALLLRFADELGDVVVAGEVVDAGVRLVHVPEDVGGDGVQAHRLGHAQAVAPVGARDARVMHLAGDDLEGLAVEREIAVLCFESVRLGGEGRTVNGQDDTQKQRKQDGRKVFHQGLVFLQMISKR